MTRSRKHKVAARERSAAEGTSYVKSLYATKSPFSGRFASVLQFADKHSSGNPSNPETEWEKTAEYCRQGIFGCRCFQKFMPARIEFWDDVLGFMPSNIIPELVGEYVDQPYTDWLWMSESARSQSYEPVIYATFLYPEGVEYGDIVGIKKGISDALAGCHVAVLPIGIIDDRGEERLGTTGDRGFRVAIKESKTVDHFSTHDWIISFASWELFDEDLWNIKNSVRCEAQEVTDVSSPRKINEVSFVADDTMTSRDMQQIADLIREKTGASWASVMEGDSLKFSDIPGMESRKHFIAHYGEHPSTQFTEREFRFGIATQIKMKKLRYSTSGEKKHAEGLPSTFSGGGIVPVGFSDCTVERNDDGIIKGYKLIPAN